VILHEMENDLNRTIGNHDINHVTIKWLRMSQMDNTNIAFSELIK